MNLKQKALEYRMQQLARQSTGLDAAQSALGHSLGTALVSVPIQQLPHAQGLPLPAYATADAAGMDLTAAIDAPLLLEPGHTLLVPTGIAIALPQGFEAQVRPRSGLALKNSITVLNAPGTIDADYRGEIKIILINHGRESFAITRGARIAQLVVCPVVQARWKPVPALETTERGSGGFGSTGVQNPIAR